MTGDKLVLGVAGMPGSGKSLVVEVARDIGYDVVIMGDAVREETKKRDLDPTPENIGKVMLELRSTEGPAVMANKCLPKIANATRQRVIVDGVRSLDEAEEFRKHYPKFTLIAVHASPETRFKRLYNRGRSDDTVQWEIFHERDARELSVGLGNAIAMAEKMILNEETPEALKSKVREVLKKVEDKWKK